MENELQSFTLQNSKGMVLKAINYGAIITELHVPDRHGQSRNVVLGLEKLENYFDEHPFFGAIAGRVAGRITGAQINLQGEVFQLLANDGDNHLHGGAKGFDKLFWDTEIKEGDDGKYLEFKLHSPDGDEGYPGALDVVIEYHLTENNELRIEYFAESTKLTSLSMTQHSYYNLKGEGEATVLDHSLCIPADTYTPGDDTMTLSGKEESVVGTIYDLRKPRVLKDIMGDFHLQHGELYWPTKPKKGELSQVAEVWEESSGRKMKVLSTYPCIQFYSGRYLSEQWKGPSGRVYQPYSGFCLECQKYPDPEGIDGRGSNYLFAGEEYRETTIYQFSTF